MKLVIVESPSKTKKIASFLGNGWQVMASFGHIRDLPEKTMGVEAPEFTPQYVVSPKAKVTVAKLRKLANAAEIVYLATDLDREGEAISWHLEQTLKLKNPKRITFSEITKTAVLNSIKQPRSINYQLVKAQEARRVADRLVGYMVSPALSRSQNQRLSAGRVQSVAVRLVVERERAINAFEPIAYFVVRIHFINGAVNWFAEWDCKSMQAKDQPYLQDKPLATALAALKAFTVSKIVDRQSSVAAPAPFTTSTLQQAASVSLGIAPKETMALAQRLYEEGLITYHRTDCRSLSVDAVNAIRDWLANNGFRNEIPVKPNTWASKADAQEAHEAIRPTEINNNVIPLDNNKASRLYRMIWERSIACQMKPALYAVTDVTLLSNDKINNVRQTFIAKGKVPVSLGWKRLTAKDTTEETTRSADATDQSLPPLVESDALTSIKGEVLDRSTKPPARYTEASLIKKMEAEGIGRPSTYASILDNIKKRLYINVNAKKKLESTELGGTIVDAMVNVFQFMDVGFTRNLEKNIDEIVSGKSNYKNIVSSLYQCLNDEISVLKIKVDDSAYTCPVCQKPFRRLKIKQSEGHFWACSGFPQCKTTAQDHDGKPVYLEKKTAIKNDILCSKCKKPMVERGGKNGVFFGCSGYPKCTHTRSID